MIRWIRDLNPRRVPQVAGVYIVVAFGLLQAADPVAVRESMITPVFRQVDRSSPVDRGRHVLRVDFMVAGLPTVETVFSVK